MAKSNAPFALSVVRLTEPGDVDRTFHRLTEFDGKSFGFSHNDTWQGLASCLRGLAPPDRADVWFAKMHPRVRNCLKGLMTLGWALKLETRRFQDFEHAGVRSIQSLQWSPDVKIRVRAPCWYVANGIAHIPLLLAHKEQLPDDRIAMYKEFGRLAYCQGEWSEAQTPLIDLSGDDPVACARFVDTEELPEVKPGTMREFVHTYLAAKRLADEKRADEKVSQAKPKEVKLDLLSVLDDLPE